MMYVWAGIAIPINLVGIAIATMGLPGIWLMLLVALGLQWITQATMFNWWTLATCAVIAVLAEIIEFISSAVVTKTKGGSRSSATGAIIGGVVGAILGAGFPPIIGAIIWSIVGAAIGAVIGEMRTGQDWKSSARLAPSAASGRFIGALSKGGLAGVVFIILTVASFVS